MMIWQTLLKTISQTWRISTRSQFSLVRWHHSIISLVISNRYLFGSNSLPTDNLKEREERFWLVLLCMCDWEDVNLISLRSSCDTTRLTEHRVLPHTFKSAADRLLSFATPHTWNSLPMHLPSVSSLQSFKKGLKTYLYTKWWLVFVSICFSLCMYIFVVM